MHAFFDNGIASFIGYRGKLLAGSYVNGVIWEVTTTGVETLFAIPELAQSGTPPTYPHAIRGMAIDNDRLYVPFLDNVGKLSVYQYDGYGWCRVAVGPVIGMPNSVRVGTSIAAETL